MRFLASLLVAGFGFAVAASSTAMAAPQAMLLVAGGDSIQFRCIDEKCLAEATAICLQEERATPHAGTEYEPLDERRYGTGRPNGLHLVGLSASGEEKALPLDKMKIVSEREHMAVRFVVARAVLEQQGLERIELRVTQNVVIAPVWQLGDPKPHLFEELDMVMGPIRDTAESTLLQRRDTVQSARLLGDLLNELPRDRVATIEERQTMFRNSVSARAGKVGSALTAESLRAAQEAIDACDFIRDKEMWYRTLQTRVSRYRSCISYRHDKLIKDVNKSYWEAIKGAGS